MAVDRYDEQPRPDWPIAPRQRAGATDGLTNSARGGEPYAGLDVDSPASAAMDLQWLREPDPEDALAPVAVNSRPGRAARNDRSDLHAGARPTHWDDEERFVALDHDDAADWPADAVPESLFHRDLADEAGYRPEPLDEVEDEPPLNGEVRSHRGSAATVPGPDSRRTPAPNTADPADPVRTVFPSGASLVVVAWLLGLVVPVSLWWMNTTPLDSTGAVLTAAGRLMGLVAGYALLTQLVLTSRLITLERLAGPERMSRWHRDIGVVLLFSLLTHVVLVAKGYAIFENLGIVGETVKLAKTAEDMLSAIGATAIIVAVGLLSVRTLRRRLPYEVWHWLHRTAYIAVLFAYGHQFALGQDLGKGFGWAYWVSLHIAVVAAVFWGRIGAPLLLNLYHQVRVAEVVEEGPGVISLYVTGHRLEELGARSGQYLRWRFLSRTSWWESHPFSLSAPPNAHWLRITVKAVGDHTSRLRAMAVGTRIWISAPSGENTSDNRTAHKALLIAAGSGIAPARALLEELPKGAVLVYRASREADLILRTELEEIARARSAQLYFVVGSRDEVAPRRLLTPDGLADLVPDVHDRDVYLCGPPEFAASITAALRELRVPAGQLHVSAFEL